jgi:hypothetical protein
MFRDDQLRLEGRISLSLRHVPSLRIASPGAVNPYESGWDAPQESKSGTRANPAKVEDFGDKDLLKHIDLARILFRRGDSTSPGSALNITMTLDLFNPKS